MNSSFAVLETFPAVYKIDLDQRLELIQLYTNLLKDVPIRDINSKFAQYVTEIIEPVDWKCIWRASIPVGNQQVKCDIEAEVVDVTHRSLEAMIILRRLLSPTPDKLTASQFDVIDDVLANQKVKTVSIKDLYVISAEDPHQRLLPTAMVIEHVRFFYKYIWRPWDELAPMNENFVENRLQLRLDLYFEVHNKVLSESLVNRINHLLAEGRKIKQQMDDLNRAIESVPESDQSDDLGLIDETDVYEMTRLKMQMEDVEREMQRLEDPYQRVVASSMGARVALTEYDERGEESVIHVVSKKYTSRELRLLTEKMTESKTEDVEMIFHKSLKRALTFGKDGDKILIFPGSYVCDKLPCLDFDVRIEGLTQNPSQIEVQENNDASPATVLLDCKSLSLYELRQNNLNK